MITRTGAAGDPCKMFYPSPDTPGEGINVGGTQDASGLCLPSDLPGATAPDVSFVKAPTAAVAPAPQWGKVALVGLAALAVAFLFTRPAYTVGD